MSRTTFGDETLMAYADGELAAAEAEAVREAAEHDAAIAARIAMFRASRQVLQGAFGPLIEDPVPRGLCDAVQALGQNAASAAVGSSRSRTTQSVRSRRRTLRLASVAAGVCAFTLAVAWRFGGSDLLRGDDRSLATVVASLPAPLTKALDRLPSGQSIRLNFGSHQAELLPVASYAGGNAVCREFEVSEPTARGMQAVRGVVCRNDGRWLLKGIADLAVAKTSSNSYLPASDSVDLAPALGLGRPLSLEEERRSQASGWRLP